MSSVPPPPIRVTDCETYRNYWLCMNATDDVELWNDQPHIGGVPCDRQALTEALVRMLRGATIVTFNGLGYDMPLITLALEGASNAALKSASDAIIVTGIKHWDIARPPEWIDHIDLIEVAPGQGSLKAYAARMHSKRLQDLPIEPSAIIGPVERQQLREYCRLGDIAATTDLFHTFPKQLALRRDMGRQYSLDLRSKSDAQIAEAVMRKILPFKVEKPPIAFGQQFMYRPPAWLAFQHLQVLQVLARSPFTIADNGSPVMTEELAATRIQIGASAYQMGSGGLHSTESEVLHDADAQWIISDHDVASYYPSLILLTGIYPKQIGPSFATIYREWYDRRLAAKAAGDSKNANSLKTLLNGTFGKLGSPWSIFYAPAEMIQVTITGQLALLMLIERLEMAGVQVISANTDGIVLKTRRTETAARDALIAWWEQATGLQTEANEYITLASRDVNSYMAIKPDGEIKRKGEYADPLPGASGWPNPNRQISIDAAAAYLRDGTPVRDTIRACTDVRQFVSVRQVKGGGYFMPRGALPKKTTLKAMRAAVGDLPKDELLLAYARAVDANVAERQYLGKIVRWYHSTNRAGCIVTGTGGLVARTDGVRPLMQLPDTMPDDVDHEWYALEAVQLLKAMGA